MRSNWTDICIMARLLNEKDIPYLNQIINEPHMLELVGMGKSSIDITEEFHLLQCYQSDDGLDNALFEQLDMRVFQGHNLFRSKGFTCIKNGKEIIKEVFNHNKNLEFIIGLTPIKYTTTTKFNKLIGFKFVKFEWLENGTFAGRYEIRRNEI